MMKGKLILVLSVLGVFNVSAQILQDGQCDPSVTLQALFDPSQFAGTWFEIGSSHDPSEGGDCSSWSITANGNGYQFSRSSLKKNIPENVIAQGTLEAGTAKFTLDYATTENVDFWILGTHYQNYAIAYRCENVNTSQRLLYIWQLGRATTIDPLFTNAMNSVLVALGISLASLRSIDHSEYACTALPVIGLNEPIVLPGQCDENISLLSDFDATRFVGTWHEIYSYYSENAVGECSNAEYTLGDGVVNVANSQVIGQALDIIIGTATVANASTAKLTVNLQIAPGVIGVQDLWIIDTDYDNYAISYSCQNINTETKRVFSWIVSRERQLSTQSQENVTQVVDSILDLNFAYYQQTNQSDAACAYTPGQFVGECDLTIPAAANFQPDLYTGLWHDIESYSTGFQEGTCNNAFYTLVDGTVDVFNTQVIDQRLDTVRGAAIPVSDDGSAKLEVTFPIAGTNLLARTNYWVLATDYTSYSFVYTCDYNNATNTKTVFSWKLSRNKFLSSQAVEDINRITSGIPVLVDRFYIARDQSPEACFYFPEPQPGVPVIFPGDCDESISAVANFAMSQFSGQWYEIETYPKPQSGQCVLHEYTEGINNNLNIASSFLINGFAASSTSVLRFNTTDNSGKFTITINDGTQDLEMPFWVLSTNYNDYAFAYSCMELEYERKAVYSWKLSRNRQQLSETAQTQIANVMEDIDVLDERYFDTMEQDEEECVPLPEIPPGQPIILDGQCNPNIPVVQNFSAGDYLGTWHLIESYWSEFQNGACNDATYSLQGDGSVLVVNSQVLNQTLDTTTLVATAATDGSGKLSVVFEGAPAPADYWIIDTDYTSYSLVYSCANLINNRQQIWSWKLSRTRSLTSEAVESIDKSISTIRVLNSAFYYTIDNSDEDCFYFPAPNGNAVTFRGQCDETIPVVTNFDAVRYMGLWYDIESYPQPFQEGSCATAEYDLRDGGVDVFNTQVVNQTLDTILGRAFLVETNDTEAKLEVIFPIAGIGDVVSPYWVLATDYTDYALVYACQNLGPDRRSVSTWKLSRDRTLSPEARQAINEVIANVDVLQQQYYEVKGHTDEECFYFPEPNGELVVFRGQCDNTISAFPNFNLESFSGVWNEIQTYPKDQAGGQCINHEFVVSNTSSTTLLLTSNQVFDSDVLISNEGQIVLDSNDGSGRFTLSINTENGEIVIPYWVLDTDYENYALVYSCMNRGNEYRAVYSWKLSRFGELSEASNEAINTNMQSVDVLQQRYFEEVSQTELACFYLPDLGLTEPVILPGQCNQSIPVVQNFSPGDYVGVWHLVETYWSEFHNGDCAEANYIAQEDGSVLVVNSEVVNQSLETMTGVATLATTDGSAKLSVIFPGAPVPVEYWVLDTDYTLFSLVYSCVNLPNNRQQVLSWKLSRARSLSENSTDRIEQKITETRVLSNRYYSTVNNTDESCFYFPEADGNPVVFRGQCDDTIPLVTNFDAVEYMGLWYDIESYPQPFQEGSCATAEYELRDGGVDVFNTQVVDQTLDTILGRAFLVETNDTQAKLEVTFPIAGVGDVLSPYWVLATDYINFALVYACQNLGPDRRSVSSWKLSRERTLSTQAQQTINQAISNIDVLQQQYYEVKGHTDEECFYYPEPNGEAVVFRGQCDNTITAFPNFDLESFAGTWNEIETYPKDQVGGQCINHEFTVTASNTTLQLTSNQVFNSETLVTNDGQIMLDSADGSGRFSLTINTASGEITMPYWILDTDYLNYALVYSCMNRDNETRAVYSWKLSRSRQISQESNVAINAAMESVDVLRQQFFEDVSQTDQDCFYLPETGPNEPVIFPGQCDSSINVMTNFDASMFSGRWFDIESYYDDYEGTCIDGNFTEINNGFDIVFTQVVNQVLDSTFSTATLAADGSGRLIVSSNGLTFEYWILDTDYTNWVLIYSCANEGSNQRRVRSWKMSRTRQLSNESNVVINAIIDNIGVLNERYFNLRDHSEPACFYYPEPNGLPITFRGRCDNSIQVVQNFSAADYLGQWYDIQSYPQFFQDGECATALYSLGEGVVDVFNTQVMNQQLDTINGFAVVVSDDESAKLDVTFVINGFEVVSPYWVLATDYNSYSLVYSCTEIDDEYKRVAAWKLSRTQNLTNDAEQLINQVMSEVQVLDDQYFRTIGHSDEDCFYYPDNNGGPVILDGLCPSPDDVNVVTNFNINSFSGSWRELYRFPSERQQGECSFTEFVVQINSEISVVNNIVNDERLITAISAGSVSADGRGVISLEDGQLFVLDTDYNQFALLYKCQQLGNSSKQIYSWVLSRSRDGLSQEISERIHARVAEEEDLFELYYDPTSQTNDDCFYYPEFEELPSFVELPGPCNENIQGIPNFDATRYLGRWFEIERYPQQDQFGECAQATYSLDDAGVHVYNTQVVNRSLLVQEGSAVVSTTDGTGVLEVTFVVNGQTIVANYYVLATDYENYALVYSCRDLDNGNSQVFSWKLSRERSISNAANQAINAVIATTRGLLNDYYISTSQSDEDCFYVPEPNPDEPVLFRTQCQDITGMQNFDVQRYLGHWHEVERYPTGQDDGECVSSNFQSDFVVVDTRVYGDRGDISTTTVTVTDDGRITRAGQGDVWVVDTDYETYAVLLSCEDYNEEYRRVWSAKHSRSRTLSESAENAITQVLENNSLLYEMFYIEVDQRDEACFYYPDANGEPVILPGQCDESIPVVTNFSIAEYTGVWYQIERYPQFHETGSCTGARYTLDEETGVVTVLNWEVIDGELDTIEGTATAIPSDDGGARLTVTLPSRVDEGEEVVTNLYVLTTDYITYALAYSCRNVDPYRRQLGVWKLSKARSLPSDSDGYEAIEEYMEQRRELDERYFITVEQNEDCEEPSSSYIIKSSIILLLVCSILQVVM